PLDTTNEAAGTEIKMISFSHNDHHDESSGAIYSFRSNVVVPFIKRKTPIQLTSRCHTPILEPTHGLVCFVNLDNFGSVLIYNPSTRDKTSWIRTSISKSFDRIPNWVSVDTPYSTMILYSCMFGFGFDPIAKQHKVLCIYKIVIQETANVSDENGYNSYREYICEVMTVGENTWKYIHQDFLHQNVEVLGHNHKSVHVNGSIYWMCHKLSELNYDTIIMAFNLGTET
ncbi:hypothetical protein MKX01_014830, partial [Papaver californicum]